MAGSEEIQGSAPRFANVGYLPREDATALLVMRMAEEQERRIKDMGNNMAQQGTILPGAAANAYQAFNTGQDRALKRSAEEQQMDMNTKRMSAMDLDMQARREQMAEEQQRRALQYGPNGQGGTAAQTAADAHLAALTNLDATKHSMLTEDQRVAIERQRAGLDARTSNFNMDAARKAQAASELTAAIGGITNDPNLTPEQKAVKKSQVTAAYAASLGNNTYAEGLSSNAGLAAAGAANAVAAGNRTVLESQAPYQTLKPLADKINASVAAVKQLDVLANQYDEGLRSYVPGFLGKAGAESASAESARAAAAAAADSIQPGLGESIRNSSGESVSDRIKQVKKIAAAHIKTQWEGAKNSIPPQVKHLPEYTQADNSVESLSKTDEKNEMNLGPKAPGGKPSVADVLRNGPVQAPMGSATAAPGIPPTQFPRSPQQAAPMVAPPPVQQQQPVVAQPPPTPGVQGYPPAYQGQGVTAPIDWSQYQHGGR